MLPFRSKILTANFIPKEIGYKPKNIFSTPAVDVEERKALNQEIKEAAVMNRTETEEDSGDEWVDHSDMEDEIDD